MRQDLFGQDVDLPDERALDAWNDALRGFMAHGAATADRLADCLAAAPDFALGHATKGLFLALLGRREMMEQARLARDTAQRLAREGGTPDPRTNALIATLVACLSGRMVEAADILTRHLRHAPGDALAMKLDHALRFVLGDARGMRTALENLAPAYGADHAAHGYFLGCRAFALEETGDYAAAERSGTAALEHTRDDAWGLHAVTHVHDMTGRSNDGLHWLDGREDAWAHCNNFRFHVWWHKALLLLDVGRIDAVLSLYDHQIRSQRTDDYRDISNAASLLLRLELEGVDVGGRWSELAELSQARCEDGCLIFADLHYLMALVGDGRQAPAHAMLRRMEAQARQGSDDVARRMARPGLSAARGLEAFGAGDYGTAFLNLAAARGQMQRAGGSHAQRDVFERLCIDCGLRAGYVVEAESILEDRRARRAGRDDGFAIARRELIATARGAAQKTLAAERIGATR
ncbi:tetratricopeptide repeat protein [Palleronia pelagia]|uniref:Tetratricopeptide repeat protein 38 n=1 Tax=Palleronia pelagia TaxID=387096 RepID=A0A1H8IPK3_9RHOB|nr:tetratricopeptide repeat protein [Palleronia pelagia]SEN69917.1 hypothetical protein SAMN04488011_105292 [Palleronia pelagia]